MRAHASYLQQELDSVAQRVGALVQRQVVAVGRVEQQKDLALSSSLLSLLLLHLLLSSLSSLLLLQLLLQLSTVRKQKHRGSNKVR